MLAGGTGVDVGVVGVLEPHAHTPRSPNAKATRWTAAPMIKTSKPETCVLSSPVPPRKLLRRHPGQQRGRNAFVTRSGRHPRAGTVCAGQSLPRARDLASASDGRR